jgi:hypothetical protein
LRYTTTTDGGSAENAWSNFPSVLAWTYSHRHPWLFAIYDHHGWWKCGKCMEQFPVRPSMDIIKARYVSSLKYYRIKVMD